MKKLLILMLVLGMASLANAGLIELSVDGEAAPSEITLLPSEYITLDITIGDTLFAGGDLMITLSTADGALDNSGVTFEANPMTRYWFGDPYYMWYDGNRAWGAPYVVGLSELQKVVVSGGNIDYNTLGNMTLADNIIFHCEKQPGDVIVELVAYSDLIYYTYVMVDDAPVVDTIETLYTEGTVLDTITVHQIPEPTTIALLGLGSLFLLRRRK